MKRVTILSTDVPTPVYHRFDTVVFEDDHNIGVMACGLKTPPYPWWTAHLRLDHAAKFARPCGRCFPKGTR